MAQGSSQEQCGTLSFTMVENNARDIACHGGHHLQNAPSLSAEIWEAYKVDTQFEEVLPSEPGGSAGDRKNLYRMPRDSLESSTYFDTEKYLSNPFDGDSHLGRSTDQGRSKACDLPFGDDDEYCDDGGDEGKDIKDCDEYTTGISHTVVASDQRTRTLREEACWRAGRESCGFTDMGLGTKGPSDSETRGSRKESLLHHLASNKKIAKQSYSRGRKFRPNLYHLNRERGACDFHKRRHKACTCNVDLSNLDG